MKHVNSSVAKAFDICPCTMDMCNGIKWDKWSSTIMGLQRDHTLLEDEGMNHTRWCQSACTRLVEDKIVNHEEWC